MSTSCYASAIQLLLEARNAPRMYASTREALLAYVCGICETSLPNFDARGFYLKHGGIRGSIYTTLFEPVDDKWARPVIGEALDFYQREIEKRYGSTFDRGTD